MLRTLLHFRHLNAAVLFGVAVAAAVLTGALMVGDSVRASLKAMTFDRLGDIDYAVIPDHFLAEDISVRIAAQLPDTLVEGAVILQGSAAGAEKRAAGVQILGVSGSFDQLYPEPVDLDAALKRGDGQIFPSAVINQTLASELGVAVGDQFLLNFENPEDINRDSIYGEKDLDKRLKSQRLQVTKIIDDRGLGSFALVPDPGLPLTVYLPRNVMQRALDRGGEVNSLFIGRKGVDGGYEEEMRQGLARALTGEDVNLVFAASEGYFSLETPSFFLNPKLVETIEQVATEQKLTQRKIASYLANKLENPNTSVITPYSLMTAVELGQEFAPARLVDGALEMDVDEIVLSQWTADDLNAQVGDELNLTYFMVADNEELVEDALPVRVKGIVAMEGVAVDREMTPEFPGVEDADNLGDWEAPFPMDLSLIRDKDETFWDTYNTTAKMFINLETAQKLWDSRFGMITGMRLGADDGRTVEEQMNAFSSGLLQAMTPEAAGLNVAPLKDLGMEASSGSTDFTGLFIGLSFFIIISALLLVGLFFRLAVSQRSNEIGILAATGHTPAKIRGRFLQEALLLCLIGSVVGALLGLLYAQGVMAGLRNWWFLGTSRLYFHFEPVSLVAGVGISLIVALLSVYGTIHQAGKQAITRLISGRLEAGKRRPGRRSRIILIVSVVLAVLLGATSSMLPATAMFFGLGTCLLIGGLAFVSTRLADRKTENAIQGTVSMAARNMSRQAGRSLVCVTLVAFACYTIVAVGLYRNSGVIDPDDPKSSAGGFFLEATADAPLYEDLSDPTDRDDLALEDELVQLLDQSTILPMRLRGGDDASCLNLFAPQEPRILGIPEQNVLDNRFTFAATLEETDDPWSLLDQKFEDGAIPVIGDANSMMWILKLQMGNDLVLQGDFGDDITLRLVGMLQKGSLFQSELLMSEEHFLEAFPTQSGFRYFLFDSKAENRDQLTAALEQGLADHGVDAVSTVEKIKAFHEIENTYISIFQMLGGLGLILGTLGMGAIIYRNALERKGEFAAMRAFGYRPNRISQLLIAENIVLLTSGMFIGTLAAVISMAPNLMGSNQLPSLSALVITLVAVFLVGVTASAWAVGQARKFPILEALRSH